MDSIYGGRPGAPFIIKGTFNSIKDMIAKFQTGASFKDVWYGEYCIIDTPNKNDYDNGKIYQRGVEWYKDDGDAKYVGQIVGPQSGVPRFEFGTIADVQKYTNLDKNGNHVEAYKEAEEGKPGYETRNWPSSGNKVFFDTPDTCKDNKDSHEDVNVFSQVPGNMFVPGMKFDSESKKWGSFEDDIQYSWVNIAYPYGEAENGDTSGMFSSAKTLVGFKIPYEVHSFNVSSKMPYNTSGTYDGSASCAEDETTRSHNFAHLWNVQIPMGVKGDSIRNIHSATKEEEDKVLNSDSTYFAKEYYTCDGLKFTSTNDGYVITPEKTYSFDADAKKTSKYWFYDFVAYNEKKDGTKYKIVVGKADEISSVKYDSVTGVLTIYHTNDEDKNYDIPAVNEFSFNQETGEWKVGFNNSAIGLNPNNFAGAVVAGGKSVSGQIVYAKNVEVLDFGEEGAESDGAKISIKASNGTVFSSNTLNSVVDFQMAKANDGSYHLYCLYSKKSKRDSEQNNASYRTGLTSGIYDKDGRLRWRDLGCVKDQSGVLVGHNLDSDELFKNDSKVDKTRSSAIVDWLNTNRRFTLVLSPDDSSLLVDESGYHYDDGKFVTYNFIEENTDTSKTWFFAWDYSQTDKTDSWYFVAEVSAGGRGRSAFIVDGAPYGDEWKMSENNELADHGKKNDIVFCASTVTYDSNDGVKESWADNWWKE